MIAEETSGSEADDAGARRESAGAPLAEIERQRRHLWTSASIALVAVSLAVVVMSYWTDVVPDSWRDGFQFAGWRFVFLILSIGFIAYALERERTFRRLTARLLEESRRAAAAETTVKELTALADVARVLAGSLERSELNDIVVAAACRLLDGDRGVLAVPDGDVLRIEAAIGFEGAAPAVVPLDEHLLGRTLRSQGPVFAPGGMVGEPARSSGAAPLIARGKVLAVVAVSSRDEMSEYDQRMLALFAEHAALAIANAAAYERERAQAKHLEEVDRMRADFVASVTHELKTPLTSLLGYATILRRRAALLDPSQREEYVQVMERQGQRILSLIESLLQSSRLESVGARLQRVPLDLGGIVRNVARELSEGRDRRIDVEVPVDPLGLFGDPTAIEHIVTNLMDNALKYSSPETPVRIAILEGDGEVLLTVADEGVGIPSDDLPHIFERFQQAPNARGRASVGLGLYIVRNLVQAHGGRVWADSEVGKGTTLTVALPRRRAR